MIRTFIYLFILTFGHLYIYTFAHIYVNMHYLFECIHFIVHSFTVSQAVLQIRSTMDLGSLNPIPFGITVINCIGR